MKVSGSILAVKNNYLDYAKALKFANVDFLHIDIFQNDGEFNLKDLMKFDASYLPLDVHLIYKNISDDEIDILSQSNIRYLNIQYENIEDKSSLLDIAKRFQGIFGLALTVETPISIIDDYLEYVSQILFMCSEPGISGARFDESNYERIIQVHQKYPSLKLFADGGINNVIGERMGAIGISMIVSGSYLCRDIEALNMNAYTLKFLNERDVNVTRNMIKSNFLPITSMHSCFTEIINIMNQYRLGMVFITENEILKGIITDSEIRKSFVKYGEKIFLQKASALMNDTPIVIDSDKTMEDVFIILAKTKKIIDVVPILESGKLIGAVNLRK